MSDKKSRHHRICNIPNLVAFMAGVGVFFPLAEWWNSNLGGIAAAIVAGATASVLWISWVRILRMGRVDSALIAPTIAAIPVGTGLPAPTLTEPGSTSAAAYHIASEQLQAVTNGRVLLLSGTSAGHGASTVALNLAISATQAGRRVALIDGDLTGNGLSRFGRNGISPGLTDLAKGNANLADISQIWTLSPTTRFPFIPPGTSRDGDANRLRGPTVSRAVDLITEHADLLLIDMPPHTESETFASLAAHTDGCVLVVTEQDHPKAVIEASNQLAEMGSPVVAHVVNRSGPDRIHSRPLWRRMIRRGITTAVVSLALFAAWSSYEVWSSWQSVERDTFNVAAAKSILPLPAGGIVPDVITDGEIPEETRSVVTAPPQPVETPLTSFLLVGSDEGGNRADVIILILLGHGDRPLMVSLPRDLYLPNRCTQGYSRINATYLGCGEEVSGPTLLALTVEDFTGIPVNHFALFDFDGFEKIIDEVGTVEICVDYAVRDRKSELDLPAGCTNASGAQALAWIRSRSTQELRNGRWQAMPSVNDLTRNQRQQDVILAMLSTLQSLETIADLSGIVRSVSEAFTLDNQLGMGDAIALAWSFRGLSSNDITRVEIPTKHFVTSGGAQVLLPTTSFDQLLFSEVANPLDLEF